MTTQQHLDKHDREIAAIRKLVLTGMKMLVELQKSQKETDRMLQALIRSLQSGGTNGHTKAR